MTEVKTDTVGKIIQANAFPLNEVPDDLDPLIQRIGNAELVLIGEASHGTHDFYSLRAEITKRLIAEKGFMGVTAEADWPDAYRVNRFVQGFGNDPNPVMALSDFKRFPSWMWRNTDVVDFIGWLKDYNDSLTGGKPKVGFYGLDLYSLYSSIEAVITYLDKVDPEAAQRARYRYSCFEHFGESPEAYGYAASFNFSEQCEREVVEELKELREKSYNYIHRDGFIAEDEFFYAEQNARVAKNAEEYYRNMFGGRIDTWNLRDTHMADTLRAISEHFQKQGKPPKLVVWEHNSHLGDARATEVSEHGEVNVGQLVRERWGDKAFNIGFTTHHGTVTAASDWGGAAERKRVRAALVGSYESLLHEEDMQRYYLLFREGNTDLRQVLLARRLERAIGVIYLPETERISHYFFARLPQQFDVIIHIDETSAVEPLERTSEWEAGEAPETYPTGI